jgi:septal ring factor EnvC (AmiA/AmiB activator)
MVIEITTEMMLGVVGALAAWTGIFIHIANRAQSKAETALSRELTRTEEKIASAFLKTHSETNAHISRLEQNVTRLDEERARIYADVRALELRIMDTISMLPQQYVRHEDWIRFSNRIDAKQDQLAELVRSLSAGKKE